MKTHAPNPTPVHGNPHRKITILLPLALMLLLSAATAHASDPIGIFALVNRVVVSPTPENPQTIQVWGIFCLAKKETRNGYHAPKAGYLYYTLPKEKPEIARKEWIDLRQIAGTGTIIGFASRYKPTGTVREAGEAPIQPDPYPVGFGIVRADRRPSEYPPVRSLREQATETQESLPKPKRSATEAN